MKLALPSPRPAALTTVAVCGLLAVVLSRTAAVELAPQPVPAGDPTLAENLALAEIVDIDNLAGIAVGDGGDPSPDVLAVQVVWSSPRAVHLFDRLVDRAGPAGVAIALAGLRELDRDRYEAALARVRPTAATRELDTQSGCMVRRTTLAAAIETVDSGQVATRYCFGSTPHIVCGIFRDREIRRLRADQPRRR